MAVRTFNSAPPLMLIPKYPFCLLIIPFGGLEISWGTSRGTSIPSGASFFFEALFIGISRSIAIWKLRLSILGAFFDFLIEPID